MRRLEIILNNFSLANAISRQVHLVFMKMYMFGIVSTTNKRLAGTGGGGGGGVGLGCRQGLWKSLVLFSFH